MRDPSVKTNKNDMKVHWVVISLTLAATSFCGRGWYLGLEVRINLASQGLKGGTDGNHQVQ